MGRFIKLVLVIVTLFGGVSVAASNLPDCPSDSNVRWHNCFGTFTWASGNKYLGEWKDGRLGGQGTLTWSNGSKYDGGWRDDQKHGQGTYTYADGTIKKGNWRFGRAQDVKTVSVAPTSIDAKTARDDIDKAAAIKSSEDFFDEMALTATENAALSTGAKLGSTGVTGTTALDIGLPTVATDMSSEEMGVREWAVSLGGDPDEAWAEWQLPEDNGVYSGDLASQRELEEIERLWIRHVASEFYENGIYNLSGEGQGVRDLATLLGSDPDEVVAVWQSENGITPDPIVSQHCAYGEAAEILNRTHGLYGSLFTGGNHGQSLASSAGSADLYRLLKSKGDLGYRNNDSVYGHSFDNTREHDGFNWILEFSKTYSDDWYAKAFVDADLNNIVDQTVDPWIPLSAKKDGTEFLTWLSFAIKSSAAPWNYLPQYVDQYHLLWDKKYSPTFTQIMQRYNQSKDLSWYVVASELAFPNVPYPELETRYKELSEKVSKCEADSAEFSAWALSSLKFEQSNLSALQIKLLPEQLLVNETISLTRRLGHELALDSELQSNRERLEDLSVNLPESLSPLPLLPLLYLTPQDDLADVVRKITSPVPDWGIFCCSSRRVQNITYQHLAKRLNLASTSVIEKIYEAVNDNSVALKSRLRGVMAARYFLDSKYEKSILLMGEIITESKIADASYGMNYLEHFLADIPIDAKAASLVLALHSVSNWPDYYHDFFNRLKSKKDIPKWIVSETQSNEDNEIYLKQLLGDPQLAEWGKDFQGGQAAADLPLDRARNSDREDIRGDTWYESKRYSLAPYQLQHAGYEDMTPIMNKSSEIILKWAAKKKESWLPWRSDPTKPHKAAALNALIYASKTNPSVGLVKNPSREAWLLIEENFLEFKHFKYWYSPSSDNYTKGDGNTLRLAEYEKYAIDNGIDPARVKAALKASGTQLSLDDLLNSLISPTEVDSECIVDGDFVTLTGAPSLEVFPGRPEYKSIEEGDEERWYWILNTKKYTCGMRLSYESGELYQVDGDFSHFQLANYKFPEKMLNDAQSNKILNGKGVITITGQIMFGHNANHVTPVVLLDGVLDTQDADDVVILQETDGRHFLTIDGKNKILSIHQNKEYEWFSTLFNNLKKAQTNEDANVKIGVYDDDMLDITAHANTFNKIIDGKKAVVIKLDGDGFKKFKQMMDKQLSNPNIGYISIYIDHSNKFYNGDFLQ